MHKNILGTRVLQESEDIPYAKDSEKDNSTGFRNAWAKGRTKMQEKGMNPQDEETLGQRKVKVQSLCSC